MIEVLRTGLNSNNDLMVALLILSGLVYYIDYSLKILGLEIYKVWLLESVLDYNVW